MRRAAILIVLVACSRVPEETAAVDANAELRESARETLATNCGQCHIRSNGTSLPRALAVFDLDEPDWSRRMSADQLREAKRRLDEPTAPSLDENAPRAIHLGPGERDRFARYVDAELARRAK